MRRYLPYQFCHSSQDAVSEGGEFQFADSGIAHRQASLGMTTHGFVERLWATRSGVPFTGYLDKVLDFRAYAEA